MTPISDAFARQIIETCHAAADLVGTLLEDAPPSAQPDIRKRIGEIFATIADQLIHPAIHQHPTSDPYKPKT